MLLGANLIFAGSSEEKLLDGVCFYLEGVPAGTTILGTCGKVFSEGVEWSIDFGDGTGTQVFSTTANIPAHTYDSAGDYVIQIIGSGITVIKPATSRFYPVIATTAKADCPYVTSITVGGDFSFFPFSAYSAGATSLIGRWNWFTNLKEIKLAKSVVECTKNGCLAYVFRYGDVEFVAPGLQLITGFHAIRYSVYRDPCALLPRGQTDLGDSSNIFAGATSLEDVSGLPRGLTGAIPPRAFSGCSKLSDTSAMPDLVTDIGDYAFQNCTSLVVADLKNVVTLGASSFSGCSALTDIYVKGVGHTNSTTSASNFLTTAIAPNVTLHYVGDVPDYDCKYATYLEHLDISKAQNVGTCAFQNCAALKNLQGFGGVTTVKDYAFQNCSSLDLSTIDFSGVETIGTGAFADSCSVGTSVDEIYLPNIKTVNNWGLGVLLDVAKNTTIRFGNKLKTFTRQSLLPVSNKSIPWKNVVFDPGSEFSAVGDRTILQGSKVLICQNDTSLPEGITEIGEFACQYGSVIRLETSDPITYGQYCFDTSAIQVVDVSNARFGSGGYEFYGCSNLTSANIRLADESRIPGSMRMFSSCTNLKNLYLECGGEGEIGPFFAKDCTSLTTATVCVGHTITTASVRDSILCYGGAFKGCSSLQYVYLPNVSGFLDATGLSAYVREIFMGCTSMKEVHFGVAHKTRVKSNTNYTTFFGLGSDYTGKIYFDLNPDGTVATNPDGSPIEPDYDGSMS